jgi:hypothetical protein
MQSSVVPNPLVIVSLIAIVLAGVGGDVMGRSGSNRTIEQYRQNYEDKLTHCYENQQTCKHYLTSCEQHSEDILNNMQGK